LNNKDICAVILAAGSSTRMGTAKQLLQLDGKYMLEHVIRNVVAQTFTKVMVVIGHKADEIRKRISIPSSHCSWIINNKYHLGQSTSFKAALEHMDSSFRSAMFFLGDQPFIKAETIKTVLEEGRHKDKSMTNPFVIRPFYEHQPGHPVYWGNVKALDSSMLSGDEGGKRLLDLVEKYYLNVNDPNILFDIDTPADFKKALKKQ
jgi:molybdenum cofactor cytidylyltransferase